MNDDMNPKLAAQIEQAMLDEDKQNPQYNVLDLKVEVTPVSLEEQRANHERAIQLMRKVQERLAAIRSIVPKPVSRHTTIAAAPGFGSLALIYEVDTVRLFIEVFTNLSVKVSFSYEQLNEQMESQLIRDVHLFGSQDPVAAIHAHIQPMLTKLLAATIANKIERFVSSYSGHPVPVNQRFDPATKALARYYNKRKKQARARTGRRS
jgi:hypothetical protein